MSAHPSDSELLALAAGELPAAAAADLRGHLEACPPCTRASAALTLARDEAVGLFAEGPDPFATRRLRHGLERALSGERGAARPLRLRPRLTVALAVVSLSGAAVAMTAGRGLLFEPEREPAAPAVVAPAPPPPALTAVVVPQTAVAPDPPRVAKAPKPAAARPPSPARHAKLEKVEREWRRALAAEGPTDWVALGDVFAQAGVVSRAADAYARAVRLSGNERGAVRLSALLREGRLGPDAALARLEPASEEAGRAETARLRCEWGLAYRGDRAAVEDCRAFGRAYPGHSAARALAFAAARLAETRLSDLPLAVEEYTRALVVSDFAGVPSTEALLGRARARMALGEREEARADLRLYLHVAPEAFHRAEVRELADALGVSIP